MRTMEERKAEVMRRSNARKKAYKRRVSIIAAIVPLVCITVIGTCVYLIKAPKIHSTNYMEDAKESSYVCVYISAEINSDSVNIKHTDVHTITEISTVLLDITNDEIDITAGGTDGSAATDAYTITLKERNDNKKTYTLCDNMLIDCEKGIQYSLTKKQLEELKNALGI